MGTISKWFTRTTDELTRKTSQQITGSAAESQALAHLQQQGLRLVTQNYRCKLGEIDLIMMDGEELVFIEVRFRKNDSHVSPLQSITPRKQQRILNTAEIYLQQHYRAYPPCRFDVVCITGNTLEWIANAFP